MKHNNFEFVDLALPSGLLWAKCNVGAETETDCGNYYKFGRGCLQYCEEENASSYYQRTDDELDPSADTATQVMGGNWKMPTQEDFQELLDNTEYSWKENFNNSGINGGKFTSKIDSTKYVFFPAAGFYNVNLNFIGACGYILTATSNFKDYARYLAFTSSNTIIYKTRRYLGLSIRGVFKN